MARTRIFVMFELDTRDMNLSQGHDTSLGHGQWECEILSRSNFAVRSNGPDTDFRYVYTVTLTLEIWLSVKLMTRPWVMDNNCVKYHQDPPWQWGVMARAHILVMCALWPWPWRYDPGSGHYTPLGTKLWPGHDVNRQTDRQTGWFLYTWYTPYFVCRGYNYWVLYWIRYLCNQ